MNLDTRAREAVESLRTATPVDAEDGLRRMHRTRHRRTTGKLIAAVAAVAVGVGVVQIQRDQDREVPVSPSGPWVLVTGSGIGGPGNPDQPVGVKWAVPLATEGVQTYPDFMDADPATRRFLVNVGLPGADWKVMTPGQRKPLVTYDCGWGGCLHSALGPGPDEVTVATYFYAHRPENSPLRLMVIGPDGQTRRELGSVWEAEAPAQGWGIGGLAWSPDGTTWAETWPEQLPDQASVSVVLRHPDSSEVTTLYQYSEPAPPWYDVDESGDLGVVPDWGAPEVFDLHWAPDSTGLAFITMSSSELVDQGKGRDRDAYELRLFVADTSTGEVDQIADLGRCDRVDGHADSRCYSHTLAWAPDGQSLTVLSNSSLITYDLTGQVLDSEPTNIAGPLVWMQSD